MTLYINTSLVDSLEVYLKNKDKLLAKKLVKAKRMQAEKLLVTIEKVLKENKIKLKDLKEIKVANSGGTFTGLRIGILTANALSYALKIPVRQLNASIKTKKNQLVKAEYGKNLNYKIKGACG